MAVTTVLLGTFTINASESRITSDSLYSLFACLQNTGSPVVSFCSSDRLMCTDPFKRHLCMFGKPKCPDLLLRSSVSVLIYPRKKHCFPAPQSLCFCDSDTGQLPVRWKQIGYVILFITNAPFSDHPAFFSSSAILASSAVS